MDPEDKDYVCTLTEYSLEKAKRELNEDPKQRLGAVSALRAWIRAQPHFTYRTDTAYLLQILRTAKFSQLRAREIIENMLTMRTRCPQYLVNIDSHDKNILKYIDSGSMIPLPKTNSEGQNIIIIRLCATDLKDPTMTPVNEMRSSLAIQELFREKDENGVVNGVQLIFDMTGLTMKHLTRETAQEQKDTTKIYQDCNPGRMKGFHLYNGGALVELVVGMMKTFMKKKFVDRMHVHSTMESLYKIFPMDMWPDEYLPDDYKGPSAGPMQAIIDNLKKGLMDPGFRARLLDYTQEKYKIDYSKKDENTPQASFRKLNID